MRQTINGADFRRLVISAAASIEINKQQLNELNVFPVPDGDTGTNMSMTINAAAVDLHIIVDNNINLNALGASIIEQVSYHVTACTGTVVRDVNVYVDSMMID